MRRMIFLGVAACGTGRAEPPPSPHFAGAAALRDAVIAGDLPRLRALAAAISTGPEPSALPDGPPRRALVDALAAASSARDMDTAALATGILAGACGDCHEQRNVALPASPAPLPEPDGTVAGDMRGHRYGAELMWSGLVGADEALFSRGVEALSRSTLAPTGLPADAKTGPISGEVEIRLQDLAAHAARTRDSAERARTTGRVLAACHLCHQVTHGGPEPK